MYDDAVDAYEAVVNDRVVRQLHLGTRLGEASVGVPAREFIHDVKIKRTSSFRAFNRRSGFTIKRESERRQRSFSRSNLGGVAGL